MVHFGHRDALSDSLLDYRRGFASAIAIFTIALAMIGGGALFKHRNAIESSSPSPSEHGLEGVPDEAHYKTNLAPHGPAASTSTTTSMAEAVRSVPATSASPKASSSDMHANNVADKTASSTR